MYALGFTCFCHLWSGNYSAANALADELVALADEKGALAWKAAGLMQQGCLLALTGRPADAIEMLTSALTTFRSVGLRNGLPYYLPLAARSYGELGQIEHA